MTIATRFPFADLRQLTLPQLHVVMGVRLCVHFEQAGRDPLPDLATRLRSVTAARAVLDLAVVAGRVWNGRFLVHRPCCMALSPDEHALALVAGAALAGDRRLTLRHLGEMLPPDDCERLHDQMLETVGAIGQSIRLRREPEPQAASRRS